jgi:hypothetical protein
MAKRNERRYPIKSDETYFLFAGTTSDKQQVLMGLACPNLVAFRFDLEGTLLTTEQRPVSFFQGVTPPYDIYDERIPPLIETWKKEMRLRAAKIKVKKFFSQEHYIGIEDYPSHFQEILTAPDADDGEKADIRESMTLWDKDGQFVLQWGNDYWLDKSGEIVSS